MKSSRSEKFKDISYAVIAGFIADYLQEGVARFFHDFTNTEAPAFEHTSSVLSAIVVIVGIQLLKDKTSLINSTIFASGLSAVLLEVIDSHLNNDEIDYESILKKFLTDATILPIILTIYYKFLDEAKKYIKRDYEGIVPEVIKNIIRAFPIIVYYGYFIFENNIRENTSEDCKNINNSLRNCKKDV